jgi:large subunit ribosomal protein L31|tara:strand:- start:38 stop:304 length:267 start_codon:yes stop_codon:yes gene_type:complete
VKKDIHPENYRLVVFQDSSCDYQFMTRSTIDTDQTIKWKDGKEYPLYKLEISDKSHPFFTGTQNLVDTAGRIEKYMKKYNLSEKELKS